MNPLRTNPEHKLHFFRERPRLLEQKVGVPFRRVTAESRRNAHLEFQPVFYGCNLTRGSRAEVRPAIFEIPARSSSQLDDSGWLLNDGLREGISSAEKR